MKNINSHTCCIRYIKRGNPNFVIRDGPVISERAGFEIANDCPIHYKQLIIHCEKMGWLIPVAYVRDQELMWDTLAE